MEIINGSNNWKLKIRRCADHIVILRALTCDSCAVLPDSLFSLPVRVIADHAFAANSREIPGEDLEIRCGLPSGEFDNSELTELALPSTINRIENYAFINCRKLKVLKLTDSIRFFGSEMFMNCRSLSRFVFDIPNDGYGITVPSMAAGLSTCMAFSINGSPDGAFSFILPEYFEDYEENIPNHDFQLHISGGGVAYRMCFKNGRPDFTEYDKLWPGYITKFHNPDTALLLAWTRLRYPLQLDSSARDTYSEYLRRRSGDVYRIILEQCDMDGLRLFSDIVGKDSPAISEALDIARTMHRTEAVAALLDYRRSTDVPRDDFCFDL